MLSEEAEWFGARLPENLTSPGVILNIGSSTHQFRTAIQPYIEERIFRPLKERGCQVVHIDQKAADGVDLVGDLRNAGFLDQLTQLRAHAVFCNNLLMHLAQPDIRQFISAVDRILHSGSLLYLSTSTRYPHTPDPRDYGFRPNDRQLAALFPGYVVEDTAIVRSERTFFNDLKRNRRLALFVAARALVPVYKPRSWYSLIRYLPSIAQPYETACVILRKA